MTRREGLLLLLTGVAAFVAALTLRIGVLPGEIHAPRYAAAFEEARRALPLLGAVRVRSAIDAAAIRLDTARGPMIERVLDPALAGAEYRYLRYLYATPEELRAVCESLERGVYPGPPPPVPDLSRFFRDTRGPYSCDVIPRTDGALDRIREVLPDAVLSGEPVRREEERRAAEGLPRSLVLGFLAAALALWFTRGRAAAVQGLLRAMLALATLCLLGWGVDRWTLPALLLVALAPQGRLLLLGLPCLLSPALALKRIGLVLLFGLLTAGRSGGSGAPAAFPLRQRSLIAALVLAAAVALHLAPVTLPANDEPIVRFVPRAERHAFAESLGSSVVYEDRTLLPPTLGTAERRSLGEIFQLADRLARAAPAGEKARWEEIVEAASNADPFLPTLLRERLVTRDGRAALWIPGGPLPEGPEYVGPQIYRIRGERDLSHDARLAALASFALVAVWCRRPLLAAVGIAGGAAFLLAFPGGEPLLPLVAVAGAAAPWTYPLALLCASIPEPLPILPWVAALLVAVLFSRR